MNEIRLNGKTEDIVAENVDKLRELFPEIIVEDKIDFSRLENVLGKYIDNNEEKYQFNWFGKTDAYRNSQIPSSGTLRPSINIKVTDENGNEVVKEDSKNFDSTQNLYIEGDNLEVLKLLKKTYGGRIKMIYIDPPYNKDKDFIYPDKWSDPIKEYKKITGQLDDDGNTTTSDSETEGGRHTKWLNMMYSRLLVARNLLKDEGFIFISIDDDELENLKKVCNDALGEENFIGQWNWFKSATPANLSYKIKKNIEYILGYQFKKNTIKFSGIKKTSSSTDPLTKQQNTIKELQFDENTLNIALKDGIYKKGIYGTDKYPNELLNDLIVENNTNKNSVTFKNRFVWLQENLKKELENKTTIFLSKNLVLTYKKQEYDNEVPPNFIPREIGNTVEESGKTLTTLFDNTTVFDYPKPVELIKYLIGFDDHKDSIILDFFSGSSTTAQAVMELNAQDNGNRKFIMVQLPENLETLLSQANKKGNEKTIITLKNAIQFLKATNKPLFLTEIGKERIRRAGDKIKADLQNKYDDYLQKQQTLFSSDESAPVNPDDLDIGFKVFKLDNSNLKRWSVDVGEDFYNLSIQEQNAILEEKLGLAINNFVAGRSELDMVYEIMLKYGLDLTYPIETYSFDKKNVYCVGMGMLFICLDDYLDENVAENIVNLVNELTPESVRIVTKDNSFNNDSNKANFKETLNSGLAIYFKKNELENKFDFITI